MKIWEAPNINQLGHLTIGGCDVVELAKTYGTPLYIMDETVLRESCRAFRDAIAKSGLIGRALFASKALCTMAICRIAASEGLGLDVVSGGELYTALQAGVNPELIYMHGNNKLPSEIEMALQAGIGRIVIDGHHEIELIASIARKMNKTARVLLRIKPGVEAHTHEYIQTGQEDSKFGLGIKDGEALKAVKAILACPELEYFGLHCHIGSQIFELDPFKLVTDIMVDLMQEIRAETGAETPELDLGGGFGIHYVSEDKPLEPEAYIQYIADALRTACKVADCSVPHFVIEPGRAIVGEAGTTAYTIGAIKDIEGIRKYVSVDGGMGDNPRLALYQAKYMAMVANKADNPARETVSIAGRCCESGDMLIYDASIAPVEEGDILAIFSTGAYNYSMASNYNRLPIPAMVLVNDGHADIIIKRQTYEQLIQNDVLPERLKR